jgi:hypothetical protein
LPLLGAIVGSLSTLALAVFVCFLGMLMYTAPQHASTSQRVLAADSSTFSKCTHADAATTLVTRVTNAWVHSRLAEAPAAAVSSTPFESQHPATPVEAEAPESGEGSLGSGIEAGDDLSDFDDFAYHLRVVFDGTAQLNREVERGVSLGGRAISRLEDNRSDKPPRG